METNDAFEDLVAQLADGAKWKVLSGEGRDEFAADLTATITELEPRRRQAIMMALFALLAGDLEPYELADFLAERDLSDDEEVELLIAWLRRNSEPPRRASDGESE